MIEVLYDNMMIPDSCRLGKRVYKRLFHENATLTATDKKALRDDVDTIVWQYTFKPTTIPIPPYEDAEREYHEVALLEVNLKQTGRAGRLAEMVHRAIPYPLFVVFVFDTTCAISLADKRFSQAEKEAMVAEGFQMTSWLNLSNLTEQQAAFVENLDISTWPHTHFYAFYRAAMDRVIALGCAELSGHYSLGTRNGLSIDERADRLAQAARLRQEQLEIQNKLKKEKNLGTQVQLNVRVKQIRDQIEAIKN